MTTEKKNPGELKRFVVTGWLAVGADTGTYWLLVSLLPASAAKTISFVAGSIVVYLLNKFWTFKLPERSGTEMAKFATLYMSTLAANVLVNHLMLAWCASLTLCADYRYQTAFVAATSTSAVLNYLGQKFWVFRRGALPNERERG